MFRNCVFVAPAILAVTSFEVDSFDSGSDSLSLIQLRASKFDATLHDAKMDGAMKMEAGGYSTFAPGICSGTDGEYSVADLTASNPGRNWYTHRGQATGICNIRNVDQCYQICSEVEGCNFFSTTLTQTCYACFVHRTCDAPSTSVGRQYTAYKMDELATTTPQPLVPTTEAFGCSQQGTASTAWTCGEWGDPHRFSSWTNGDKDDNPRRMGWHWYAKSKDGEMKVQVFLAQSSRKPWFPVVAAYAGQFGDTTFKVLKRRTGDVQGFKLIINGEEQQPDSPQKTFPSGFYVEPFTGTGRLASTTANVRVCMDSADKRFTIRSTGSRWQGGPGGIPIEMELIADDADIDKNFPSFCTSETPNQPMVVDPADIIVTADENIELCRLEGVSDEDCQDPPVVPPFPGVEQKCMDSGIAFADAQAACESQRSRGHGMFDGCVEDCCALGNLDDCATIPEEFDELVDSETVLGDAAAAVDDPHVSTVSGKHFDLD